MEAHYGLRYARNSVDSATSDRYGVTPESSITEIALGSYYVCDSVCLVLNLTHRVIAVFPGWPAARWGLVTSVSLIRRRADISRLNNRYSLA